MRDLLVELGYGVDRRGKLGKYLELAQDIERHVQSIQSFVIKRKMGYAVVGIGIFIILVVTHHYRSIVSQTVTAHQRQIILECTSAHRIAPALKLGQSVSAGLDQIIDCSASVMILQTLVNSRNPYQRRAVKRLRKRF